MRSVDLLRLLDREPKTIRLLSQKLGIHPVEVQHAMELLFTQARAKRHINQSGVYTWSLPPKS